MFNINNVKKFLTNINGQLVFTAIIFFIIGIYFRFEALEVVRIAEWVTRDFDRAFHLFDGDYIPLAGPERGNGGRLLGPFLYFFLTIPLFFNYSYESIFIFNLILNIGSIIFFFWLINKYFGVLTASITSILLSVNIVHLDSVGFPINPTFMFPLLFIFLWLLFKITLENKANYIPWIFVTISLGIQMHFSMAAYYLVPIIICLLFKIKVPLKQISIGMGLLGLCFLPYLIYKSNYYETDIEIIKSYFNQTFTFLQILKIISLQNVLYRINQGTSLYGYYSIPDYIVQIEFLISCISLYGLALFICFKLKKTGLESCKKEFIIFLFFYITAIIYEITNPSTGWHFWHYFIFIPPMIMVKGIFCQLILRNIDSRNIQHIIYVFLVLIISFQFTHMLINIMTLNNQHNFQRKNFSSFYKYSYLKILLNSIKKELPKDIPNKNIYFHNFNIGGLRYLEGNNNFLDNNTFECYFISENKKRSKFLPDFTDYSIIETLKNDKTIELKNNKRVLLKDKIYLKVFDIAKYIPKYNQPCYTNTKNPFAVGIEVNKYLKNSFNINKSFDQKLVIKSINKKISFSESSFLEKLIKTEIIFNRDINTPIQTIFSILKFNEKYRVKIDLLYYSWGKAYKDYFKIKELKFKILGKNKSFEFPIISSDSWVFNNVNNRGTENFSWYRELELPKNFELKKNNFSINLYWDITFPQNKEKCCLKFKTELEN